MTLFRQLISSVLVLFVVLYGINIFVSLNNSRILVEEQMRVHAQDTATSLGISMSQAAAEKDIASLDTLFNAVSDSGFFQRIYFTGLDGRVEIDRSFPVSIETVPGWFVDWVSFPAFEGKSQVTTGWTQLGELTVVSHPGQAYLKLWQITVAQLLWFLLATFVACLLAYSALHWLLTPLRAVERQADAIANGDFKVQENVPKTRELKSVVEAMNRMSGKLKKLFTDQLDLITRLRKLSATDAVTGLPNRADFDAKLESHVGAETGPHSGGLMVISVSDLEEVNRLGGRVAGNAILQMMTEHLFTALEDHPKSIIARRQGSEFCLFVPDVDAREADQIAKQVFLNIKSITWQHQDKSPLVYHMGYVHKESIEDVGELLRAADMSLKKARALGKNILQNYADIDLGEVPVLSHSADHWQEFIQKAMGEQSFKLFYQPVLSVPDKAIVANEVYVRFPKNETLFSAGAIIPVAERLGLMPRLDKMILENLAEWHDSTGYNLTLRVNLSHYSIRSENYFVWLDLFLSKHPKFAKNLVVEVAEFAVHASQDAVTLMNQVLQKYQTGLCIDHFGLESSSFSYLGSLKINSLKVHRSFVKNLEENTDNQFYIKALANLAHNMDVKLYVEGVESESQWDVLKKLNVDACQGFYLGEPSLNPVTG